MVEAKAKDEGRNAQMFSKQRFSRKKIAKFLRNFKRSQKSLRAENRKIFVNF